MLCTLGSFQVYGLNSRGPSKAGAHREARFELQKHSVIDISNGTIETGLELEQHSHVLKKAVDLGFNFDVLEESGAHEYHVGVHIGIDCVHYSLNLLTELSSDFFTQNDFETELDMVKHFKINQNLELVPAFVVLYSEQEITSALQISLSQRY